MHTKTHLKSIFAEAFDTFKAFDNLSVESSGLHQEAFPTSIWQILNHLIRWQASQLDQLRGTQWTEVLHEEKTWVEEKYPQKEAELQFAVAQLNGQLEAIKREVDRLDADSADSVTTFRLVQEMALHLSFHLGEVVLLRRLQGTYPLPHQMKAFLSQGRSRVG